MTATTARWAPRRARAAAAHAAMPLVYAVNRPSLAWLGRAAFDLALRLNGAGINYRGRHGLTAGEERFLGRLLDASEAGALVDVGANAGAYAARLATLCPRSRVFAFEPHPATFLRLAEATRRLAPVRAIRSAVGRAEGTARLFDFADGDGSTQASLTEAAIGLFGAQAVGHDVEVTTIDAFMRKRGLGSLRLLKIDTEGHDLDVLRGASEAIARKAIATIQFEVIPANVATRVFVRDFYEALPGYAIHRLCLNGQLAPLGQYDPARCEVFMTHNLVALPA